MGKLFRKFWQGASAEQRSAFAAIVGATAASVRAGCSPDKANPSVALAARVAAASGGEVPLSDLRPDACAAFDLAAAALGVSRAAFDAAFADLARAFKEDPAAPRDKYRYAGLKMFLQEMRPGQREAFAEQCGTTLANLRTRMGRNEPLPLPLAARVAHIAKGRAPLSKTRPDLHDALGAMALRLHVPRDRVLPALAPVLPLLRRASKC